MPGDESEALRDRGGLGEVGVLVAGAGRESRVLGAGRGEALVDDPGIGDDPGAFEVLAQALCLMDGRRLRERDDQHLGVLGVAQPRKELRDSVGDL